ncbi:MAG: hypothetical protein K2O04_03090 [Clostridiales bacterium]|nr:hypothetical protein [Clostridiales bacterium]
MAKLEQLCEKFFDYNIACDSSDIDCFVAAVRRFCGSGKKDDAFSVYYCFCEMFKIFGAFDSMNNLLEFLSDHEYHSGERLYTNLDHYSHSVYEFVLGLAIYANDGNFRQTFLDFYKSDCATDTCFLRWWGLAALFHDIGYPFQLAHEQIKTYAQGMWGDAVNVPHVAYEGMDLLLNIGDDVKKQGSVFNADTVGDVLSRGINLRLGYPLPVITELISTRYAHQDRYMDHGYFSALLLFNRLAAAHADFSGPIIDVLTAIALHNNLNSQSIKGALNIDIAIPAVRHPLAYLLVLCDELQDWDRTAFGYVSKKDPLARTVDMSVADGRIDMCYVFDCFSVASFEERSVDGKTAVVQVERQNANYKKIASGDFVKNISGLVKGDIVLSVTAREQPSVKKSSALQSSDRLVNLCDFSRAIHKSYQCEYGGPDFDDISLEFRLSNIEQAKSYARKLDLINCFYSERELSCPLVSEFTPDELEALAREEHVRWVREKLQAGWKYGTDYSSKSERDKKKIHRDIVPYDLLPSSERKKDELMINNIIPFLYCYGHGVRIYRSQGGKPTLNIAGTGHRSVSSSIPELKEKIKDILRRYQTDYRVVVCTNYAFGSDQIIAECATELGITTTAVIPLPYEDYIQSIKADARESGYGFTEADENRMRNLLAQAVSCTVVDDEKYTYTQATKHIIDNCQMLIALWDGVETPLSDGYGNPINQGGTYYGISYAKSIGLKDEQIHVIGIKR